VCRYAVDAAVARRAAEAGALTGGHTKAAAGSSWFGGAGKGEKGAGNDVYALLKSPKVGRCNPKH
jgi:hypothetical protein